MSDDATQIAAEAIDRAYDDGDGTLTVQESATVAIAALRAAGYPLVKLATLEAEIAGMPTTLGDDHYAGETAAFKADVLALLRRVGGTP